MSLYLCLAFSTGRLRTAADDHLLTALAFVLTLFFGASLLFSPTLSGEGPLLACGPCPDNPFQIGSQPELLERDREGRRPTSGWRSSPGSPPSGSGASAQATRPQRRTLVPVAASSLLLVPALFVVYFSVLVLGVERRHVRDALVAARRHVDPVSARFRGRAPAGRSLRRPRVPPAPERAREPAHTGALARHRRRGTRRSLAPARVLGSALRSLPRRGGRRARTSTRSACAGSGRRSGATGCPSQHSTRTTRWPRIPSSSTPPRRRRCWPSRPEGSRASCAPRRRAPSPPRQPSGAGSGATCTTPPSSGSSPSASISASPASSCSPRSSPSSRSSSGSWTRRSTSCRASRAASIRTCSQSTASPPPCARPFAARRFR